MATISIIGNSPSSGSTLLADLLDSTQYSACGVELNFFSNKRIYNFSEYRKNIFQTSSSSSIYLYRNGVNIHRLHSYGLDISEYKKIVEMASDLSGFVDNFANDYLGLRGKNENGIFFEKTPQNINCIGDFLHTFKDGYFIYIVRNPLYVYLSLLNRGFPKYIALITWLIDVAQYFKYKEHKKVILVKYEELVELPFKHVKDVLRVITNKTISEDEIKYGYENNRYRKAHSKKMKKWKINKYGKVENANYTVFSKENLTDFSTLLNAKIHPTYAEIFDLEEISFIELAKEFDYYDWIIERLSSVKCENTIPTKTKEDYNRLLIKWLGDFIKKDSKWSYLKYYLNPIEKSKI